MQAKMETAAQKYRKGKEARLKEVETFDLPSKIIPNMVWKLRRPDLSQFVATGVLPMSLAQHLDRAQKANGGDAEKAFASLEWKDQAKTIELVSKIVRYCAVEPRIVETVTNPDIEIGFDEVEMEDYNAIAEWAIKGGTAAEGLETFRTE